jgi:general secretion pathway protein I
MAERPAGRGLAIADRSAEHGFTLIEIMVALAVFALAVLALVRLESATVRGASMVDETLAAAMLARSIATDAATQARAPTRGTTTGGEVNGGRPWRWTRIVAPTADSRVLSIDVVVTDPRGVERARATQVRSSIGDPAP